MANTEMATLTIEGFEVTVPKGTMVIEAAKQAGIVVPHYCYHPGLPVAGVCRMCLVEIEGAPKLQIACATEVAEGQVVLLYTDEASKARKSVLEYLLINHPLDCPICDQAGECELQDFVFQEGQSNTRYGAFAKRFIPVEDFGPDVLYVANRCILCTRCVRFMDHVAEDDVLNVSERGDRAVIGIHPDATLDHEWAGNVVDLCPVGSLISKDFLHKARAWELDKTPGICTGCSQGCNINLDTRENVVVRLRPRGNDEVNRYFMCDTGRLHYRWMNRGDRIEAPLVIQGGGLQATDWDHALQDVARLVQGSCGRAVALVSPNASTEALYLTKELLAGLDATLRFRTPTVEGEHPLPGVPNLALREERAANAAGAKALGYTSDSAAAGKAIQGASLVVVLDDDLNGVSREALEKAANLIYIGTILPEAARGAAAVLPVANVAEEDGTFVNRDGRVQRYAQAKVAPGLARPAWWVLSEVLRELGRGESLFSAEEAFARMAEAEGAFSGLSHAALGLRGQILSQAGV
ncbi:MAG: 2Fe-2S iron-sulfur cluster-binding protein [Gemmatimonadetes bacterium]|nr:2Fe-2S iron-sulfur cluster-binding protein [Gemmatimonadota bacterium]